MEWRGGKGRSRKRKRHCEREEGRGVVEGIGGKRKVGGDRGLEVVWVGG